MGDYNRFIKKMADIYSDKEKEEEKKSKDKKGEDDEEIISTRS